MIKIVEIRKNSKIKKVLFMVILLSFMFIDQNPEFQEEMQNTENVRENLVVSPLAAEVHDPIFIEGNAGLIAFCADNEKDGLSWPTAYMIKDYEIDAGASGSAIEIRDTTLFVIIQNCTVTNSESGYPYAGIYLNNCTNVKITGCNSSFNLDYGIYLYDSHDCIITGNNARNNTEHGIYLEQSSNNTLSGNNVSFNEAYGILFGNYCDNNIISENLVSNNSWDGIYIYEFCVNNTISENNVSFNADHGIYLYFFCVNNTISGNIVCNNTNDGIYFNDNCDNNIISKNNVSFNEINGIFLEFECVNNTISENNVSFNYNGIYLYENCDNNIISKNIVSNNSWEGIYLDSNCNNNTIMGNNASYNDNGIILDSYCDNNTIMGNNAYYNDNGIYLNDNCDNNTIMGNNASYNDNGIHVDANNEDNSILGNDLSFNAGYGILLSDGDNTSVFGNNVSFNQYGISIGAKSQSCQIWMNFISNNSIYQGSESTLNSLWDNGTVGNYWGDYQDLYPDASAIGNIWDTNYTIYDISNNNNDTKPLVNVDPIIDLLPSNNVKYLLGETGYLISWTITDIYYMNPEYYIYHDDVLVEEGNWVSGDSVSLNVDGLDVGTYSFRIVVYDGTAWGKNENTIEVEVGVIPDSPVFITPSQTINSTNITIQWTAVNLTDFYNIYINDTYEGNTTTTEYLLDFNSAGEYVIEITSQNEYGESIRSLSIIIIVEEPIPADSNNNLFWYFFGGGWLLVAGFIGIAFVKVKMKK